MEQKQFILERFKKENICINNVQAEQFVDYYHLLTEWNQVMNLTAITEFEEVVEKHFLDSGLLFKYFPEIPFNTVLDIGTGAGFPGIPLKILRPECKLVLLDSLQKRIRFLDKVVENLRLKQVTTIHGRAEELAGREHREGYDCCISRAVARLTSLCELCIPYVRVEGSFVAYKARKAEEEVEEAKKAIHLLGGVIERQVKYSLKEEYSRSLILIRKVKSTDKKYPRGSGKPIKEPLV